MGVVLQGLQRLTREKRWPADQEKNEAPAEDMELWMWKAANVFGHSKEAGRKCFKAQPMSIRVLAEAAHAFLERNNHPQVCWMAKPVLSPLASNYAVSREEETNLALRSPSGSHETNYP